MDAIKNLENELNGEIAKYNYEIDFGSNIRAKTIKRNKIDPLI